MTTTGGVAALVACLAVAASAGPQGGDGAAGANQDPKQAPNQDATPADTTADDVQRLRDEMHAMEARHRAEMEALRAELARRDDSSGGDLTAEIDALMDRVDGLEASVSAQPRGGGAFRLVDLSLNALIAAGGASEGDDTIAALNAGGHDPNRRGFTVQNVELIVKGAVDPYFNAQANVVYQIDRDGESTVELEEAWVKTTSMPWDLQAKVGQFFTDFGRHNPQHPHQWDFVDMPFGWTRILGPDGMRGPGAQISWLLPTETAVQLTGAVQNANGETMSSFISDGGAVVGSPREREVRSLDDLVWTGRGTASFDLSDEWTTLLGASTAYGPNAAGSQAQTWLRGFDLTARWKPLDNERGFPFVNVRFEYLGRDYEFDAFSNAAGRTVGSGNLNDDTWYLQTGWGFTTDWTLGARYERYRGDSTDDVLGLEDRDRLSLALTHYFSEFSKVRLQLNRDHSDVLGDVTSVWLQFEFNLGAHGAHTF